MSEHAVPIQIPISTTATWQEIVNILAEIVDIPAALIMRLKGPDIEVFISSNSDHNPYHPGDREHFDGSGLYCETVIKSGEQLLVPNALADPDWENNPDVRLGMISYLGLPIRLPDGTPFGTICILDRQANAYSKKFESLLLKFKTMVEADLELLYLNRVLGDENRQLSDYLAEIQALRGLVPICAGCKSIRDIDDQWHPIEHYLIRLPSVDLTHGLCPDCLEEFYSEYK